MKAQDTAPLLATLAPAAVIAPPVVIVGALIAAGLIWLLSSENESDEKPKPLSDAPPGSEAPPTSPLAAKPLGRVKRVTREDMAEALAYGAKRLTRKEAVAALEALGFRKSSAYQALSQDGKFGSLIEFTPDGLIEWKG